jgi:hypothetical protein
MRNFLMGALLGATAMYWYLVHGGMLSATIADIWAEVSAPPASAHRAAP